MPLFPGSHRAGGPAAKTPAGKATAAPGNQKALKALYDEYLAEARGLGETLKKSFSSCKIQTTEKDLIPFIYV